MAAILLTIAYDGADYAGWQVQDNALTIQECMMKAGACFLPEGFTITTASRTDAGVHALGQRALLRAETAIPAEKINEAFNHYLPKDIRVWKAERVNDDFHPRYQAKKKLYVYQIWNGRTGIPVYQRTHTLIRDKCDYQKMQYIADKFIGQHDFNAFSSAKKTVKDTIRRIYRCQVEICPNPYIDPDLGQALAIYVEGNGFLYNMVRIMAGTIIDWSSQNISYREIDARLEKAFQTGDRNLTARTMPAKGLTLLKIDY